MQNAVYFSDTIDPLYNLALEDALFCSVREGCTLYLRQCARNVSIGVAQNASTACRFSLLEQEGGLLLRRAYGGGAMYGDEGALAFTLIAPRSGFDVKKLEEMLLHALFTLGIDARCEDGLLFTTRDHARVSDRATCATGDTALYQGLLYVNADLERMARYAAASSKNGFEPNAFANIGGLGQRPHMEKAKRALIEAFIRQFGPARMGRLNALQHEAIAKTRERLASPEWRCLNNPRYELTLERQFPFGNVELQFHIRRAQVADIAAYSDAMEPEFVSAIAPALKGAAFRAEALAHQLCRTQFAQCAELARWLREMGF